jgi:hypothetical protein
MSDNRTSEAEKKECKCDGSVELYYQFGFPMRKCLNCGESQELPVFPDLQDA